MTIIDFPANRIAPPADKRAEIERLARELGGVVIWPTRRMTARDCILQVLGCRLAMTPAQIAVAANVSYEYTRHLLTALKRDGLVIREKSRRYGGWILVTPLDKAA